MIHGEDGGLVLGHSGADEDGVMITDPQRLLSPYEFLSCLVTWIHK